jgi:hypothetical protein
MPQSLSKFDQFTALTQTRFNHQLYLILIKALYHDILKKEEVIN